MKNKTARTVKELVDFRCGDSPNNVFIEYYDYDKKVIIEKKYSLFQKDTYAFGKYIKSLSDQKQKQLHVGFIGVTSYGYIVSSVGTMISGNVMVVIDPLLPEKEICGHLNFADVEVLVFDKMFRPAIEAIRKLCPQIHLFIDMSIENAAADGTEALPDIIKNNTGELNYNPSPDDFCAIIFTSGTTEASSKGVMLSQRNLSHNAVTVTINDVLPDEGVVLSVLPINHLFCYTCDVLISLAKGYTVAINDSVMHLSENLLRFNPTLMFAVPMIVKSMYNNLYLAKKKNPQLSNQTIAKNVLGENLAVIVAGGAYLESELVDKFKEYEIVVFQGYGMTENSPVIVAGSYLRKQGNSCGELLDGIDVKIVDGEIYTKSESVMMGYYKNPEATEEAITEDGWLKTGDLGYIDENKFLYITGRAKNLIILANGENISPEEIESKYKIDGFVEEVLVYGEDNVIIAEVFPNDEFVKGNKIQDVEAYLLKLTDAVNNQLPSYKAVGKCKIRSESFPKTAAGKIKRKL